LKGQAVHFGAGSIGRGFLGQIYCESGYHTTFIDVVPSVVNALNERGNYPLHIVSDTGMETTHITDVSAISGTSLEDAAAALARADIASTAVGLHALPHIAPVIARAVALRFENKDAASLDILICENLKDGEAHVRGLVAGHLAPSLLETLETRVGFIEASIGRMVPVITPEQRAEDPLAVWVEPYCELPVDARGFRGPIPPLKNLKPSSDFGAYVERKLFVHNLTHAATAYLGHLRGYAYVYEAIRDDTVRARVEAAGRETCRALVKKYGMDAASLEVHLQDLIYRYHNRALADPIARVGRDPVRKLGPEDRLVGAMGLCRSQNIASHAVAMAAAAAILYDNPGDEAAMQVQALLRKGGVAAVLREICGLSPDSTAYIMIQRAFQALRKNVKES
jgi:mannitol-1-phosphate 5-dehydrogenase